MHPDDDASWSELIGPAYHPEQAAQLLGVEPAQLDAIDGLLCLEQRDGTLAYPASQFDGRAQLPGVADVVIALEGAVATAWTTGSWLHTPHDQLDGLTPIDALRDGQVDRVTGQARRWAAQLRNA